MKTGMVVLFGAALAFAPAAWGQDSGDIVALGHGRALYLTHCAGCHGALGLDVHGKPVRELRTGTNGAAPPELALVVARDGTFKVVHVASHIGGRASDERASRTMPCWGKLLASEWPTGEAMAALKVYWLTKYLESAQETTAIAQR
jgi:mono/diheme cytochrome c family protein